MNLGISHLSNKQAKGFKSGFQMQLLNLYLIVHGTIEQHETSFLVVPQDDWDKVGFSKDQAPILQTVTSITSCQNRRKTNSHTWKCNCFQLYRIMPKNIYGRGQSWQVLYSLYSSFFLLLQWNSLLLLCMVAQSGPLGFMGIFLP